jgi:hypothetical protein
MHNENHTAGEELVSYDCLEAILKLAHSGSSPEAISSFLDLNVQIVIQIIDNDPMHRAREVKSIKERSAEYRCTLSKRLMVSPVMARDGNFYERSILEADPSVSIDQFIPSPELKAKIADFSNESLKGLERYLRQKPTQEDILELTAECLSVLAPEAGMETALRVLDAVEGKTVRKLFGMLRGLVSEERLLSLMNQIARELPSHALCLSAVIILEPRIERAFEEAFRCFTELLSHAALGPEAIDLAEEVSERLSSTQLSQMNAALGASPREGRDRLDGLRLREAYALLREGEVGAAIRLVHNLRSNPRLDKELVSFYDEAQMIQMSDETTQESLKSLREEIRALHEQAAISGRKTMQLQVEIEKTQGAVAASEMTIDSLRQDVKDMDEALSQFKRTQSSQEVLLQALPKKSQITETTQSALMSRTDTVEALPEVLLKTLEEIKRSQKAQDNAIQRASTQESLSSTREELQVMYELASRSAEETRQIQSFIEQSQKAEAATRQAFNSLRDKAEAFTGVHFKPGEMKSVKRAQDVQIQGLDARFNKAEAAAKQTLNIHRGVFETLRLDLDRALSQCIRSCQCSPNIKAPKVAVEVKAPEIKASKVEVKAPKVEVRFEVPKFGFKAGGFLISEESPTVFSSGLIASSFKTEVTAPKISAEVRATKEKVRFEVPKFGLRAGGFSISEESPTVFSSGLIAS